MVHLCDTCSKKNKCTIYQNRRGWGDKAPITSCTNYKEVKGIKKLISKNRG